MQQPTLNQRVPGSSPGAPTNKINHLYENRPRQSGRKTTLDNVWDNNLQVWGRVKQPRQILWYSALNCETSMPSANSGLFSMPLLRLQIEDRGQTLFRDATLNVSSPETWVTERT